MKPNVLLITADQWRGAALGCAGHGEVKTPNVDALAREGVLFRQHFAGAAPCSPARACLYTGLAQMNNRVTRNGTPMDDRLDNIARLARRAGYDPTLFGYTDVSPDPRTRDSHDPDLTTYEGVLPGFTTRVLLPEHEKAWLSWLRERGHRIDDPSTIHVPVGHAPGTVTRDAPVYSADETQTAFLTGEFLRWLSEREGERPWFAHISFLRPHPPFVVPAPYNTMYEARTDGFLRPGTRAEQADVHPYVAAELARVGAGHFLAGASGGTEQWSAEDHGVIRAIYHGMISEVDAQLGRLFDGLKAAGSFDNTLIIFTSDHAELMGDHWGFGKGGFYDQSYHIPLVVKLPGADGARGETVTAFTSACDIFPTLADYLGVTPQTGPDGQSLRPFLEARAPARWRDAVVWEFDFRDIKSGRQETHFGLPSRALSLAVLRDDRFKYVHFAGGLPPLLFDMVNDPGELRNLAEDPAWQAVRLACAERLLDWRTQHLDQTLAYTELTASGPVSRPFSDD
jgi:arylsulfatase A-like enzyme